MGNEAQNEAQNETQPNTCSAVGDEEKPRTAGGG